MDSLAIALEHPLLSSSPKVLCAAAQVCSAWRRAVQECGACNLNVELRRSKLSTISSFAAWLPRHAALVRSITATAEDFTRTDDGAPPQQFMAVAHQLLRPALQLAQLLPADAAATAEGPARSTLTGPQKQPGLQLQRFCSNWPRSAGMLADLPAHSLTALDLDFQLSIGVDGSTLSALLARLSSLQQLRLSTVDGCMSIPGSCLAGIASLSQLTQLELAGSWQLPAQSLQHLLQQPLPLRRLKLLPPVLPQLNMTSLTSLEEFEMSSELRQGSVLPAQLQRLRLHDCSSTSGVTAIQQLQQLSLGVQFEDREQLLGLAQLPSLPLLALNYSAAAPAVATAPAWQHLPQLQELSVVFQYVDFPRAQQMQGILAGIAACTQLTKLELAVGHKLAGQAADDAADDDADAGGVFPIAVCDSLAGLAGLRSLTIPMPSWMVPADALALTALTALTYLDLSGAGNGVDDLVASALACSLKQLRHLDLTFCHLEHMACMAAISHLSQLTFLGLVGVGEAYERALMQLTNLPCLQRLSFSQDIGVSKEVIDSIYAAMRQRRR